MALTAAVTVLNHYDYIPHGIVVATGLRTSTLPYHTQCLWRKAYINPGDAARYPFPAEHIRPSSRAGE